MASRAIEVRPLSGRDVGEAGALLARAFARDPLIGVLLGGSTRSLRHRIAYPAFFRLAIRDALAGGRVDAAVDSRLLGVAVWLDPALPPSPAGRRQRVDRGLVALAFPTGLRRIEAGFEELARTTPARSTATWRLSGLSPGSMVRASGRHSSRQDWPRPMPGAWCAISRRRFPRPSPSTRVSGPCGRCDERQVVPYDVPPSSDIRAR